VLLGVIYNASTPDLYPNNAHHKLGWIVTFVVGAQVVVGLLARVAGVLRRKNSSAEERQGFVPVSTEAVAEHESRFELSPYRRFSDDSGHGTEPGSASLRSHSPSSPTRLAHKELGLGDDDESDDDSEANVPIFSKSTRAHSVVAKVAGRISDRFWKVLLLAYAFVDRAILPLGFIAICTGVVAFGRFFVSFHRTA
jgi:hypothetical protein